MTISEAIANTQEKQVGVMNRRSVRYAQSLLSDDENVIAAIVANVRTKRDNYPGIVAITDRRILTACGLPGIKRSFSIPLDELENCEEASTVIQYKATFRTRREAIAITANPDVGETFSTYVAQLNGEDLESVKLKITGKVSKATFLKYKMRNQAYKEQAKARDLSNDILLQEKAAARFDSAESDKNNSKPS